MTSKCASCGRVLPDVDMYRRRGDTFRPGSIMPMTSRHLRGKRALCGDCYAELPPARKRDYSAGRAGYG